MYSEDDQVSEKNNYKPNSSIANQDVFYDKFGNAPGFYGQVVAVDVRYVLYYIPGIFNIGCSKENVRKTDKIESDENLPYRNPPFFFKTKLFVEIFLVGFIEGRSSKIHSVQHSPDDEGPACSVPESW